MSISSEFFNEQESSLFAAGDAGVSVIQTPSQSSLSFAECPTSAKVSRAALTAIAVGLPLAGLVSGNPALFAFSIIGSALSLVAASRINDYNDPLELQKMRAEAPLLSWTQLTNKHDLSRLNQVLSLGEISLKFQANYQGRLFSDIVYNYSLSTIDKYQLASFSENSFLKTCFLREMKQFPLSTLRAWYSQGWGLGNFPYRGILPARQMDAFLDIRAHLINADTKKSQSLQVLDYQFPYRMDIWVQELNSKELDISWKVRENGKQVEDAVKDAYTYEILMATTFSEELEIKKERDEVALGARREAESIERERLESELFWERWDPIRTVLASDQQALYDMGVVSIKEEHSFQESLCIKYILEII